MKPVLPLALAIVFAAAGTATAQDKMFDWRPANSEAVRLDPGYYHAGHVYRPGSNGGNMHVDIESQKPVTVALAPESQWNEAVQHFEHLNNVNFLCRQEHVTKTTYICNIPPEPMVLVIRDERNNTDRVILAGVNAAVRTGDRAIDRAVALGATTVLTGSNSVTHHYVSPNDLHIQYYSWLCIQNCEQPEFRWYLKAKEKYQLTPILKVYGGIFPDHDGEQISVKIKSPIPMAVAVLPSSIANQLHMSPETLEAALAKSSCQQRGVQSLTWECPLNQADGPLSVVVIPESVSKVPHKKAEIEVYETKCVEHCYVPPPPPVSQAKASQ
jgi:hypothetical protein